MAGDRFENESNIWPISTEIKVNWGDMDALGHVNHSVYAKWMETVRMMYFSEIGMMNLYDDSNIGPILARIEIDYELPIVFPDVVTVSTSVSRIGNSSFDMRYKKFPVGEPTVRQLDVVAAMGGCFFYLSPVLLLFFVWHKVGIIKIKMVN